MLFTEKAKLTFMLIVIACLVSATSKKARRTRVKHGPSGMQFNDHTNCSEFSKFGRFNPLSVLREKWFVFFYWAPLRSLTTFIFTYPTANHTKHLKKLLNGNVVLPVMWSARQILMEDNKQRISLLVERGDRGEYWMYPVAKVKGLQKITPIDIRMKQTGDNRLLGLMDCVEQTLLVMARLNDVPRKNKLHEEAARLGYRGRKGRSYLYQGHEWGPIPEADEEMFWDYTKKDSEGIEDKSSEGISDKVESQLTNKPEHSKEKKSKVRESKDILPADLDPEMCVKVEPELWNDPKPDPKPDNLLITKEELDNLDNISNTNNTLTIEAQDESPNNNQENKLDEESEKTQENDKLDNQKDVQIPEMEGSLNVPNNLELHTDNADPEEEENCVVCYKSQVSYVYTSESYIPQNTRSIANLKNNEEVPRAEVPRTEVPRTKVPRAEEPRAEVPRAEVPHPEVRMAEVPRAEISHAKVPPGPTAPQQDLTNSSEIIILSPTLDDLKS